MGIVNFRVRATVGFENSELRSFCSLELRTRERERGEKEGVATYARISRLVFHIMLNACIFLCPHIFEKIEGRNEIQNLLFLLEFDA